ncbi:MAG: DUF4124 domain-containing protein [Betaproteobacteria bacterium]|nr:MAG: DUF4124 domain-containing protein [Betaproteobacteria bacterium]
MTTVKMHGPAEDKLVRVMRQVGFAVVLLLLSAAVAGETIYKYRLPEGRTVYSDRVLPGAILLESFEHQFPRPAASETDPEKGRLQAEERIRSHLAALEKAWQEVQDARVALARAEERVRAGVEPLEAEPIQHAGPAAPASPSVGGPPPPAPPAVGGPQPAAPPAVGGPMGTRHGGGGRSPEFHARIGALERDVQAARERLDTAQRRYNALR